MSLADYRTLRELGRGAAGVVSLVRRRRDGRAFAAKAISFGNDNGSNRVPGGVEGSLEHRAVRKEISLMRSVPQHPSIVALEEAIDVPGGVVLILEYVDGGSLQEVVYPNGAPPPSTGLVVGRGGTVSTATNYQSFHRQQEGGGGAAAASQSSTVYETWGDSTPAFGGGVAAASSSTLLGGGGVPPAFPPPIPEERILVWLFQLANALHFLHTHSVVHRDIKLCNVLLTSASQIVKIADFGVSENLLVQGREKRVHATVGTPHYMAPEVCDGRPCGTAADVWSLGVMGFEMCCRRPPFNSRNVLALADAILSAAVPLVPTSAAEVESLGLPPGYDYSEGCREIVAGMLTRDPRQRATAAQVVQQIRLHRQGATAAEVRAVVVQRDGSDGNAPAPPTANLSEPRDEPQRIYVQGSTYNEGPGGVGESVAAVLAPSIDKAGRGTALDMPQTSAFGGRRDSSIISASDRASVFAENRRLAAENRRRAGRTSSSPIPPSDPPLPLAVMPTATNGLPGVVDQQQQHIVATTSYEDGSVSNLVLPPDLTAEGSGPPSGPPPLRSEPRRRSVSPPHLDAHSPQLIDQEQLWERRRSQEGFAAGRPAGVPGLAVGENQLKQHHQHPSGWLRASSGSELSAEALRAAHQDLTKQHEDALAALFPDTPRSPRGGNGDTARFSAPDAQVAVVKGSAATPNKPAALPSGSTMNLDTVPTEDYPLPFEGVGGGGGSPRDRSSLLPAVAGASASTLPSMATPNPASTEAPFNPATMRLSATGSTFVVEPELPPKKTVGGGMPSTLVAPPRPGMSRPAFSAAANTATRDLDCASCRWKPGDASTTNKANAVVDGDDDCCGDDPSRQFLQYCHECRLVLCARCADTLHAGQRDRLLHKRFLLDHRVDASAVVAPAGSKPGSQSTPPEKETAHVAAGPSRRGSASTNRTTKRRDAASADESHSGCCLVS